MIKILLKFWPALIPLLLYFVWFFFLRKKKGEEEAISTSEAKLWIVTLSATLLIAIAMIIWMALESESNVDSTYVPPTMKDGKVEPGKFIPEKP